MISKRKNNIFSSSFLITMLKVTTLINMIMMDSTKSSQIDKYKIIKPNYDKINNNNLNDYYSRGEEDMANRSHFDYQNQFSFYKNLNKFIENYNKNKNNNDYKNNFNEEKYNYFFKKHKNGIKSLNYINDNIKNNDNNKFMSDNKKINKNKNNNHFHEQYNYESGYNKNLNKNFNNINNISNKNENNNNLDNVVKNIENKIINKFDGNREHNDDHNNKEESENRSKGERRIWWTPLHKRILSLDKRPYYYTIGWDGQLKKHYISGSYRWDLGKRKKKK